MLPTLCARSLVPLRLPGRVCTCWTLSNLIDLKPVVCRLYRQTLMQKLLKQMASQLLHPCVEGLLRLKNPSIFDMAAVHKQVHH